ncbi:MAG: phage integrase SAM-like domain-containing protein [Chitinophagaceae bacterium]|nr:phage integrase SAM-like domain-containing protein [Chitinophagaceae bacterium]
MLLPLKLVCKTLKARKDGTSKVHIQYCHSSKERILLDPEIAIPFQYWNEKKQCISGDLPQRYGDPEILNDQLNKALRIAEDIVLLIGKRTLANPLDFVKRTFSLGFDLATFLIQEKEEQQRKLKEEKTTLNLDFFFQVDNYITSKIKQVSKDMPRIYRNMRDHLKAFEAYSKEAITFDSLDYTFYEQLVEFLSYVYIQQGRTKMTIVGLKLNSVGKTVKHLRTFLRNRIRKRIIPPLDMDGWTILEEDSDAIYLNWDEINLIAKVDLMEHPHLEDYRQDFVLGCYTGLRFSDFSLLDELDVRGDMLYKKQAKSNHWVVIPLRPAALEIVTRRFHKGVLPPTNPEFNRHIKTIARLAGICSMVKHSYKKGNASVVEVKPKYGWITSHTCRRSFCTNEFLAGTPVELIMKISGHKSVKDFYKYIRITPEQAAIEIKRIWDKRNELRIA